MVDLYFDPSGTQNVVETLIEEGIHFDYVLSESECDTVSDRGEDSLSYSELGSENEATRNGHDESLNVAKIPTEHSPVVSIRGGKVSPWKRLQTAYGMIS